MAEAKGRGTQVRDVTTEGVCRACDDGTVENAVQLMIEQRVRCLPVGNRDKRLAGIEALGDVAVGSFTIQPVAEALARISETS